jgi:hypothetical protein
MRNPLKKMPNELHGYANIDFKKKTHEIHRNREIFSKIIVLQRHFLMLQLNN